MDPVLVSLSDKNSLYGSSAQMSVRENQRTLKGDRTRLRIVDPLLWRN